MKVSTWFLSAVVLAGCDPRPDEVPGDDDDDVVGVYVDRDKDGWDTAYDCDDDDDAIHPSATDACDGVDNDCDGATDEDLGQATVSYRDADQDGFGDPGDARTTCALAAGWVADGGDCDDARDDVHPGAEERCDGVDEDCDLAVDEDAVDASVWYDDADGDGFGDPATASLGCGLLGSTLEGTDCDDLDAATNPGAPERCGDDVDADCDGTPSNTCVVEHCGAITADETWDAGAVHHVTCTVSVAGSAAPTLTLAPGVRVEFDPGTSLVVGVGAPGTLDILGGEWLGELTSAQARPLPGDWGGLVFGDQDRQSALRGVVVAFAGGAGAVGAIHALANTNRHPLVVEGSIVRDNLGAGAVFDAGSVPSVSASQFLDNGGIGMQMDGNWGAATTSSVFSGNEAPLGLPAAEVAGLGDDNTFVGNEVDELRVSGGTLTASAAWPDHGVPYAVLGTVYVGGPAAPTLTLEPGAHLAFAASQGLVVGYTGLGSLVATGTVDDPVVLDAHDAGSWGGVVAWAGDVTLDGAVVERGGAAGSGCVGTPVTSTARVTIVGSAVGFCDDWTLAEFGWATWSVVDSVLYDSGGDGLVVAQSATLAALSGTTIRDHGGVPLRIWGHTLPAIDGMNAVAGNAVDEIVVQTGTVLADAALWDLGVPWHVVGDVFVTGPARPALTVAAGVEVRFGPSVDLVVGDQFAPGTLVAEPGARFTSDADVPAPGDWGGVRFDHNSGGSAMDGAVVEYAGGNGVAGVFLFHSGNEGEVVALSGVELRDNAHGGVFCDACLLSLTGSTVRRSAGDGVRTTNGPGALVDFTGGSLLDNDGVALASDAVSVAALDLAGLVVAGNGVDGVEFTGSTWSGTHTLADLGLAYVVTDDLTVDAGERLTVEPGVELRFATGAGLVVLGGTLDAVGTPAAPIVFTAASASPTAGDWDGLWIQGSPTTTLREVEVHFAGGNGSGGVVCVDDDFTLDDALVADSSRWGLYRGPGCTGTYPTVSYAGNVSGTLF